MFRLNLFNCYLSMTLSLEEANSLLDGISTKEELRALVGRLSADTKGRITLLYSGMLATDPLDANHNISAREIVWGIKENGDDIRIVDNTDAARFLNIDPDSPNQNKALFNALSRIFNSNPNREGTDANRFLYGDIIDGKRVPNGIWDEVSARFVAATTGEVITITGGARSDRVFAQTELPAILASDAITHVDGIRIQELRAMTAQQALDAIRAQSEVRSANLQISVDASGRPIEVDGTYRVDTRNFFSDVPGIEGREPLTKTSMRSLAEFIPEERLREHVAGVEQLRLSRQHLTDQLSQLTGPEHAVARAEVLKALDRLGVAADIFSLAMIAHEAKTAYEAGDTTKARDILSKWVLDNVGGIVAGRLASLAVAPLLAAGPAGALVAVSLTMMASMAGSEYADDLVEWMTNSLTAWNEGFRFALEKQRTLAARQSPLILDLDGDTVETLSREMAAVRFDLDANGFAEVAGWIHPDDGFLVRDLNGNGQIDNGGEMFGNHTRLANGTLAPNGFVALKELDANQDGVVNIKDDSWSSLRIWKDTNTNTKVDPGEFLLLEEAGVQSLGLAYSARRSEFAPRIESNGNTHQQFGQYVTTKGSKRDMDDVWFRVDPSRSTFLSPVQVSQSIALLPDLDGMGNVMGLHQAMATDSSGKLQALVERWVAGSLAERAELLEPIIFCWTGSEFTNPAEYAPLPNDPRKIGALSAFSGRPYADAITRTFFEAQFPIEEAFQLLSKKINEQLTLHADVVPLVRLLSVAWDPTTDAYRLNVHEVVEALRRQFVLNPSIECYQQIQQALLSLGGDSLRSEFKAQIAKLAYREDWPFCSALLTVASDYSSHGTRDDDSLATNQRDGFLNGNEGDDQLFGSLGDDTIHGGLGNDYLLGQMGNNTYLFGRGDGSDLIRSWYFGDALRHSVLRFKPGISPADVIVASSQGGEDLFLRIAGTADAVQIQQFIPDNITSIYESPVQEICFDDGTSWSVSDVLSKVYVGNSDNNTLLGTVDPDRITGLAGNDSIFGGQGNDTLAGGPGDDFLVGDLGSDTYLFSIGDGTDRIRELKGAAVDGTASDLNLIIFGKGIQASQVALSRSMNSLWMLLPGSMGLLIVDNYFADLKAGTLPRYELRFDDGSLWAIDQNLALTSLAKPGDNDPPKPGSSMIDAAVGASPAPQLNGNGSQTLSPKPVESVDVTALEPVPVVPPLPPTLQGETIQSPTHSSTTIAADSVPFPASATSAPTSPAIHPPASVAPVSTISPPSSGPSFANPEPVLPDPVIPDPVIPEPPNPSGVLNGLNPVTQPTTDGITGLDRDPHWNTPTAIPPTPQLSSPPSMGSVPLPISQDMIINFLPPVSSGQPRLPAPVVLSSQIDQLLSRFTRRRSRTLTPPRPTLPLIGAQAKRLAGAESSPLPGTMADGQPDGLGDILSAQPWRATSELLSGALLL